MAEHPWSGIQSRRLKELGADPSMQQQIFDSPEARDRAFQGLERELVQGCRERLEQLRRLRFRPRICGLESALVEALGRRGFVQVATPTIMSKGLLARMSIGPDHPLSSQVYWLDGEHCLRPMLAPHLYFLLKDLLRLWEKPVRIFEVGSCFRKESRGSQHSSEFTMLDLVEMGLAQEARQERLEEWVALVARAAGLRDYCLKEQKSAVYGQTVDILAGGRQIEVGSAAMGPHPLDLPWGISEPWVGVGFGLERLLMASEGSASLKPWARSLAYLDGIRLNI